MQATLQATPKTKENLQETSTDKVAAFAGKFGKLCTSGNVEIVDGKMVTNQGRAGGQWRLKMARSDAEHREKHFPEARGEQQWPQR
jgi:hypothetical protein